MADVLTQSPSRAKASPLSTGTQHFEPRTPRRNDKAIGPFEGQVLRRTPQTPKTPRTPRVRFSKDETQQRNPAIPGSTQTEPESSQWHVPTQYTPRKGGQTHSSQTEPESSQWRVPTQYTPKKRQMMSSQTEPESSQWRVPTQRTPRRARRWDALLAGDDDEPAAHSFPFSLPVASYDEEFDFNMLPPSSTSPLRKMPVPADSQDDELPSGFSTFNLSQSQLSERALQRMAHIQTKYGQHGGDASQDSISGAPLSIPSD